jgi:hypothetical protein
MSGSGLRLSLSSELEWASVDSLGLPTDLQKLDNPVAAVALYVAHYNLCRVHEALCTTPAKALGVAEVA